MRPPPLPPCFCGWTMSDGYLVRGRFWAPPAGPPRGAVLYLHGIQSHGGWFAWSASLLAQHGCFVLLPDRRGSGMNPEARGDVSAADRWLADIDELAAWVRQQTGLERLSLVAVSWGGKLAAAWAVRNPQRVGRLLLSTPGVFPAVDVRRAERMRIAAALLLGGRGEFRIPLDDPERFTDNPDGQAFIRNDPLKLTRATARFLFHSARLERRLRRLPHGALSPPMTLLLAGRDRIIANGPTEAWARRVSGGRARVICRPDQAHTMEFARDTSAYEQVLVEWAVGAT